MRMQSGEAPKKCVCRRRETWQYSTESKSTNREREEPIGAIMMQALLGTTVPSITKDCGVLPH
jgi:hypothetical protein